MCIDKTIEFGLVNNDHNLNNIWWSMCRSFLWVCFGVAFTDTRHTSATIFWLHLNSINISTSDCHKVFSVFISTVFSISLFYFYWLSFAWAKMSFQWIFPNKYRVIDHLDLIEMRGIHIWCALYRQFQYEYHQTNGSLRLLLYIFFLLFHLFTCWLRKKFRVLHNNLWI